ncbi:MFS transporter [Nonlabens spongiae]|uniref:MFS transporter n=1 Tax=Nonlabens spongiae TaxID=331648 RepID=A0A1W6MGJ4_9FLAO|nr:sugar porter family MFS transporter [Nonlabens spongiae]ARN76599.1 MFS transporter [Nonlabens spongiae]
MSKKLILIAFVVSLGGFLFGFDAGIISGVMNYANPEFNLTETQSGWVVSSPSFAAMFAMLFAGRLSDAIGRKRVLIGVAAFYAVSAIFSALAESYHMLYIARMIGGVAFGAALVLAPVYIAEVSTTKDRGKLVAIQQLNIVLGFFAAFLSNYFFNEALNSLTSFLTDGNVWRYMLGIETIPAIIYLAALFLVPRSPRWLFLKERENEAATVMKFIHGEVIGLQEMNSISQQSDNSAQGENEVSYKVLFKKSLRFIIIVGLIVAILQQITGINAVYFYATSIFEQTGIGTDASFTSSVLLSCVTVLFTILAMLLIDKMGRRPLLLFGTAGIAISLLLCAYGFNSAKYQLTTQSIDQLKFAEKELLRPIQNQVFLSDVEFKNELKQRLDNQVYLANDGDLLQAAITMNATLVFVGILGFIACFAFSLGPVMWVLLSELYPLKVRGIIIGTIAFVNSLISSLVQLVFPWELANLGNALTFFIFGAIALVGLFIMIKILPETKGRSLEELELELVGEKV